MSEAAGQAEVGLPSSTGADAVMPQKAPDGVVRHLLFHKAIIDEEGDSSRFDRYMALATARTADSIGNPVDRAFFNLFDVVIKENMDPWKIDLAGFSKEYMRRLKGDSMDFIIAGRVICLAYQILEMKSSDLALRATAEEEKAQEPVWEVPSFFDEPLDVDYTGKVLAGELPLVPPLAESQTRPISLIELVDALEEARAEAEIQLRISEYRRTHRPPELKIDLRGKIHDENITEDIMATWQRIRDAKSDSLPFARVYGDSVEDMVTVFLSVLFLAQMRKIRIEQKDFPRGDITVTLLERTLDVRADAEQFRVVLAKQGGMKGGNTDALPTSGPPSPSIEVTR